MPRWRRHHRGFHRAQARIRARAGRPVDRHQRQCQEFHHPGFARHVEETLDRTGIDGRRIVFESTESIPIDRVTATIDRMERLRRRGVAFAVDDFGTGYSSLTYLERLPVDTIRIDRGCVRDLDGDPADGAIVEGIIAMADRLGLHVVAAFGSTAMALRAGTREPGPRG